jgi:hypothetical protein
MIAILEQQVRENYEQQLNNSIVDKSKYFINIINFSLIFVLDELWNLYLDFCVQRLSQASDSTKNEVKKYLSEVGNTVK